MNHFPGRQGGINQAFRHPEKRNLVELYEQALAFDQESRVRYPGSAISANTLAWKEFFPNQFFIEERL